MIDAGVMAQCKDYLGDGASVSSEIILSDKRDKPLPLWRCQYAKIFCVLASCIHTCLQEV